MAIQICLKQRHCSGRWRRSSRTGSSGLQKCNALPEALAAMADSPYRDAACFGVGTVGAAAMVKLFDMLASNGVLEQVKFAYGTDLAA